MSLRLFLFLTLSPFFAFSQPAFSNWLKPKEGAKIEPFLAFQLWSAYSMGQEVYDTGTKQYVPAGDRFNVFFRRGRAGLKASPYDNLSFTFIAAFDGLGKDALNAALGPANNLTTPQLSLWETFLQWKAGKVILTAGYFRPQLSRESITAAWGVNSMEKAMSQTYIRKHLTGIGTGRAPGLNLGGLILPEGKNWGLNYNVGIFNPVYQAYNGNSTGFRFSPVFVGRNTRRAIRSTTLVSERVSRSPAAAPGKGLPISSTAPGRLPQTCFSTGVPSTSTASGTGCGATTIFPRPDIYAPATTWR
jgi:hypothetical protein